jgi:predicted NBD/HSP70 family sugar kinase
MLFLGLGTGLGSALIVDGEVEPMELGHLPYKKGTYESYVGRAGLERDGKNKWRRRVADALERLIAALHPDETVIGRRKRKKAARPAGTLSSGPQCERLPRRFSAVGQRQSRAPGSSARAYSSPRKR